MECVAPRALCSAPTASHALFHYAPARRSPFTPVMSRGTWACLLDLQKTRNVFTDGARHLVEHACLRAEAAEAAVVEFCEDYSKLEAHFKSVPREGGASGGGSPVAAAQAALPVPTAEPAAPPAAQPAPAADAAPRAKFFVAIDSRGQVRSLHSTEKGAIFSILRNTYDRCSVLELELDGKEYCTDGDTDEEDAEEPATKRGRSSAE